jgi:hypothetical protein
MLMPPIRRDGGLSFAMSRDIKVEQASMVFYGRGEPVIALDKVDMHVPGGQFAAMTLTVELAARDQKSIRHST